MRPDRALAYVRRQGLEGEVATFLARGQIGDRPNARRPLLAVVYGDYPDRRTAQAAAEALRERLPGIRPWVRSFRSVQAVLAAGGQAASSPSPAPSGTGGQGLDAARVHADEKRILQRPPERYVLQLMAMDLSAAARRLARWGILEEVMLYRTLRDDRELVAVLYGDYPSRESARQAAAEIQQRIAGIQPWIRSVRAVQAAIRTFHDIHR